MRQERKERRKWREQGRAAKGRSPNLDHQTLRVFLGQGLAAAVMMKAVRPSVLPGAGGRPFRPSCSAEASEAAFMATREGGILTTPLRVTRTDERRRRGYFICIISEFQSAAIIAGGKFRLSPPCESSQNLRTAAVQRTKGRSI